jgi:single-strand DNA-binding protein
MPQANNVAVITGRAGRDPEVRTVGTDRMVASVTVAVNRPTKDSEGNYITDWFNCEFWGKQADLAGELIKKGALVSVSGSFRADKWESNGEKKTKYFIAGDAFQLLSSKSENSGSGESHSYQQAAPKSAPKAKTKTDDFDLDDDIPPF